MKRVTGTVNGAKRSQIVTMPCVNYQIGLCLQIN